MLRQVIVDNETTGLYANAGDRIIEFAGLEMISRRLTGKRLHFLIYPDCDIHEEAIKIHGITLEALQGAPRFHEVGLEIQEFLKGAELIIHNAPFDVAFLDQEFLRMGLPRVESIVDNVIDTLAHAKKKYPGKRNSLDALCDRLSIDKSSRVFHGALVDCELLAKVYLAMTHGQYSLDMVLEAESGVRKADSGQGMFEFGELNLKVLKATKEELNLHESYLDELQAVVSPIYRLGSS
ncbi:MAG: DNA polymerase III subunit epsilon [Neisseriaceae bacterium]